VLFKSFLFAGPNAARPPKIEVRFTNSDDNEHSAEFSVDHRKLSLICALL
jgi:hypothetical protein